VSSIITMYAARVTDSISVHALQVRFVGGWAFRTIMDLRRAIEMMVDEKH
jgi:hypothetical protein